MATTGLPSNDAASGPASGGLDALGGLLWAGVSVAGS
jgi:hypothetical protein